MPGNPAVGGPVSPPMTTFRRSTVSTPRSIAIVLASLALSALAGCSASAGPATAPPSPAPTAPAGSQPPSDDPNASVDSGLPAASDEPGIVDPAGKLVTPRPGQLDVHPIPAERLTATVDGRRVTVTVAYTSGVEPCYVLDSILVAVGAEARTFAITLREGHGPEDVACIEIAQNKRTVVDLGELDAGTYALSDATGGAAPISVTVP